MTLLPVTEILPSLTAKRAIRKKGVRPPSGLFITEMGRHAAEAGRQGGVTLTSTTAAIGRTKSAENVVVFTLFPVAALCVMACAPLI